MSTHHVQALTDQQLDAEVLASPIPVLVDFTASWCAPCRALSPILHALAEEHAGRLAVRTVDGDAYASLAARHRVKAFPTVIAFAGGKEVGRHVGLTTKARLLKLLEGKIAAAA